MPSVRPLVPVGTRLHWSILARDLYGSVETGWPVLWKGGAVWPAN